MEGTLRSYPRSPPDAHRPLRQEYDLATISSHVEQKTITNDYTIQFRGQRYQITRNSVLMSMCAKKHSGSAPDGSFAIRYRGQYLLAEVWVGSHPIGLETIEQSGSQKP
jgi:hypothetical protein